MKICHICYFAAQGGAAIAAMRLHQALLQHGEDSRFMAVVHQNLPGITPLGTPWKIFFMRQFQRIVHNSYRFARSSNYSGHTFQFFPGGLLPEILAQRPDIIHLHSIAGEMMSVPEIGRLCRQARVVWTFHDGWPYTGTEQYFLPGSAPRYRDGYTHNNHEDRGLDLDRFYWNRTRRYWKDMPLHIISPSNYLAREIRESALFRNNPVIVIPHGLDAEAFSPGDRNTACAELGLNPKQNYIGLAAVDFNNRVKGGDLAKKLVELLVNKNDNVVFLVAGAAAELAAMSSTNRVRCLEELSQQKMQLFYRTLTLFFNPTRLESFGLTNLEALFSGVPVLSTNCSAVPEVVSHLENGYLAEPENLNDFLRGFHYILQNRPRLSKNARAAAKENFSAAQMAEQHVALYRKILSST